MTSFLRARCRRALIAVIAGLGFLQAGSAAAATFTVTPTRVDLAGANANTLLTLKNESTQPIRFQITTSAWSQSDSGEIQLAPTEDILFFPALLTLGPGESKKVRVAASTTPGASEKTYRIFFEELPPLETPEVQGAASVRILTKMGVPIFVAPEKRRVEAAVSDPVFANGKLTFDVTNGGTVRYSIYNAKVYGLGAGGVQLFEKEQSGWYVLAGGKRTFDLQLTPEEAKSVSSFRIEVNTDQPADGGFSKLTKEVPVATGGSS
jgi:fimbrial chaperone protein